MFETTLYYNVLRMQSVISLVPSLHIFKNLEDASFPKKNQIFGTYTTSQYMSSVNKMIHDILVLEQPTRLAVQQITHKIHLKY